MELFSKNMTVLAVYLVNTIFIYKANTEIIGLSILFLLHIILSQFNLTAIYEWYKNQAPDDVLTKCGVFAIGYGFFMNFLSLYIILMAIFFMKNKYESANKPNMALPAKQRVALNNFKLCYLFELAIFFLGAYVVNNIIINGKYSTKFTALSVICFLSAVALSTYEFSNALSFVGIKDKLILQ
jgi:hypothetical protein